MVRVLKTQTVQSIGYILLNPHIFHIFTKTKSPKPYKIKGLRLSNRAADRNRTGTGITTHGILSPGRLPVPPLRHIKLKKWGL